ncbi:MAG: hypothetical protein JW806_09500 [Sedimentisphaerales bacterium]|nr:hypothetical protein [Sedimentisphaerales bacterium]
MKKMPLILSLMANVFLLLSIFVVRLHYHKMIYQTLYNVTSHKVRFNETLLTELRSENEYKVETVKAMLEHDIQRGEERAEIYKSAAERIRLR